MLSVVKPVFAEIIFCVYMVGKGELTVATEIFFVYSLQIVLSRTPFFIRAPRLPGPSQTGFRPGNWHCRAFDWRNNADTGLQALLLYLCYSIIF